MADVGIVFVWSVCISIGIDAASVSSCKDPMNSERDIGFESELDGCQMSVALINVDTTVFGLWPTQSTVLGQIRPVVISIK